MVHLFPSNLDFNTLHPKTRNYGIYKRIQNIPYCFDVYTEDNLIGFDLSQEDALCKLFDLKKNYFIEELFRFSHKKEVNCLCVKTYYVNDYIFFTLDVLPST